MVILALMLWGPGPLLATNTPPGIVVKIEVGAPPPVGGVLSPVDKLAIVASYLALLGLVGAVLAVILLLRHNPGHLTIRQARLA
jgi:hypothetical protein